MYYELKPTAFQVFAIASVLIGTVNQNSLLRLLGVVLAVKAIQRSLYA